VRRLAETVSRDGVRSLWVGTDHGLSRRRGGVWTRYDTSSGFPDAGVTALAASHTAQGDAVLWAGTFRAGLARFNEDGGWQIFDTGSGLPANFIFALLAADSGRGEPVLWLSTASGIARLDRERWRGISSREGLPHDTVVGVGEATFPDGVRSYWAGTLGGMARLGIHGWDRYTPDPALEPTVARQIVNKAEDDGSTAFWMGTVNGLRRFAHGRWTLFEARSSPLPGDLVLALLSMPWQGHEALWVGTNHGVARIEGERWTVYRRADGMPADEVSTLLAIPATPAAPGAQGPPVVWAGTERGLARYSGGRWARVSLPCLPSPDIVSLQWLAESGNAGWLWIGTRGGVVRVRIADGEVRPAACEALTDKTDPPLPNAVIGSSKIDAAGRVYLFTNSGVVRLTLAPGKGLSAARMELFDRDDGLPGTFFSSAVFKDRFGRLWTGTSGGLALFDAPVEPQGGAPDRPAPLYLEHIRVNGRERTLPAGTVLRHDENNLELEFALLSFRREHATLYRTQLAGLEREPSTWSRDTREIYTRLPPGDYVFRVWGKDADGVVSGPLQVSFAVQRAPWLRTWALALYALVLMGLGYGFNHLRLRRVAHRAAALEALVAERTRELAEANAKLEQASLTDPLTGLSNRRFVALNIEPDLRLAERNYLGSGGKDRNRDLLIYLLDVDRFKEFNDRNGHPAGDAVLVELAQRLRNVARSSDAVVRWGGEELLLISRFTDRASGEALAARLLEAVGGVPFTFGQGMTATVTCSVGWAPYPWRPEAPEAVSFEHVVSLADRALYLAKREGRDRAVGVLPGPAELPMPEDGPLDHLEGASIALIRTTRGSREISKPSLAAL
jgi:diguanylate cyclase (GGDEF)-like protein